VEAQRPEYQKSWGTRKKSSRNPSRHTTPHHINMRAFPLSGPRTPGPSEYKQDPRGWPSLYCPPPPPKKMRRAPTATPTPIPMATLMATPTAPTLPEENGGWVLTWPATPPHYIRENGGWTPTASSPAATPAAASPAATPTSSRAARRLQAFNALPDERLQAPAPTPQHLARQERIIKRKLYAGK